MNADKTIPFDPRLFAFISGPLLLFLPALPPGRLACASERNGGRAGAMDGMKTSIGRGHAW
jgi:hypothetical protein